MTTGDSCNNLACGIHVLRPEFEVSRGPVPRPGRPGYEILGRFFAAVAIPDYSYFGFLERFGVNLEAFSGHSGIPKPGGELQPMRQP